MALAAGQARVSSTESEPGVAEGCIPVAGVMARGTICSELPGMDRRLGVAGGTCSGYCPVNPAGMALVAGQAIMSAGKREPGMVEGCIPVGGVMARDTIRSELPGMGCRFRMAGYTRRG